MTLLRVKRRVSLKLFSTTLVVAATWATWSTPVHGQQAEKLVVNPPLSQVFPLDLKPDGVRVKYPVLLNDRTILGPEVLLRFIYDDPNAGMHGHGDGGLGGNNASGGGGGRRRHGGGDDGDTEDAYSRDAGGPGAGASHADAAPSGNSSDANKADKSEITTEVWTSVEPFHEALEEAADMGTTVVYSVPGKPHPLSTTIDLPDGMLLAEVGGHVRVLALADESDAGSAGLQPDDEIRSLNGGDDIVSLKDFLRDFIATREAARKSNQPYSMQIWRPASGKLIVIQVGAPPSFPSLFQN